MCNKILFSRIWRRHPTQWSGTCGGEHDNSKRDIPIGELFIPQQHRHGDHVQTSWEDRFLRSFCELCVLERALPTELLRQLSWLGWITHTQSKAEALCVLERALYTNWATEAAQLAGPNHSHTEQDRALCVLERALPTELLRQLSWLGRITHTQSKTEHFVF